MSILKPKMFPFMRNVIKNLFSKPATTKYPFEPARFPEGMRGHVSIRIEDCISCGLCVRSCPSGALTVDRKAGTWTINRFDCVQCGNCVNLCPKKCLALDTGYTKPGVEKVSETFTRPVLEEEKSPGGKKPVNQTEQCVYCGLCAKKCPQEAISVNRQEKKWMLEKEKCVGCGICASACPKKCLNMEG